MNIAVRKLAMLEKSLLEQEAVAKVQGYTTNVVDHELKKKVADLMDRVRVI